VACLEHLYESQTFKLLKPSDLVPLHRVFRQSLGLERRLVLLANVLGHRHLSISVAKPVFVSGVN
jgi:hypothetical protein